MCQQANVSSLFLMTRFCLSASSCHDRPSLSLSKQQLLRDDVSVPKQLLLDAGSGGH